MFDIHRWLISCSKKASRDPLGIAAGLFETFCAWVLSHQHFVFQNSPVRYPHKEEAVRKGEAKKCASAIHDRRVL